MTDMFFVDHGTPINAPEQVIPFLGSEMHWRPGRPSYEIVHSWFAAKGIPPSVQQTMATDALFVSAKALKVYFERKTDLDGLGRESQTDIVALVGATDRNAVVGIEAKVDETFGPVVIDWNITPGKDKRLEGLLRVLGIAKENAWHLRYQLLHRTVATIIEAANFRTRDAALIVQSFSPSSARVGFHDFQEFTRLMNARVTEPGRLTPPVNVHGVALRFGWVQDRPKKAISLTV